MPATHLSDAQHMVTSPDGVRLAVFEYGDRAAPTVVAIHGYPDNHQVWEPAARLLSRDYHVVAYDVRGAGESDKPTRRADYRMTRLIDDLAAVIEAVSPREPVHLLGHDWGSIQAWPAVTSERLAGRVATFTSVSGPSLDYSSAWIRRVREHPRASLRQLIHSYYIGLFQLPRVPEAVARAGLVNRAAQRLEMQQRGADGVAPHGAHPDRSEADTVNGIWLYRANVPAALISPTLTPTTIPVQVIVADGDPFATSQLAVEAPAPWVADLTVRHVPGGHWIIHTAPEVVAEILHEYLVERGISQR